jgi:hypothetical protein
VPPRAWSIEWPIVASSIDHLGRLPSMESPIDQVHPRQSGQTEVALYCSQFAGAQAKAGGRPPEGSTPIPPVIGLHTPKRGVTSLTHVAPRAAPSKCPRHPTVRDRSAG